MKWVRLGLTGGSGQALEDGAKVESSIEQILNLAEISMRVLVESEGVVRAGQCGLQVTQGCVDGQERWVLGAGGTAAGDVLLVQDAATAYCREATQAVDDESDRRGQRLLV